MITQNFQLLQAWKIRIAALFFFSFFFTSISFAQAPLKKDYIVVADTIYSQGIVEDIPQEENTVIFFARIKKEEFKKFTIQEVGEFRISERMFFRKTIVLNNENKVAFLEKLPHFSDQVTIWKWNGETNYYFIESQAGIVQLEANYQQQLNEVYGNPDLSSLIDLTQLKDLSLIYLAKTAKTIQKPRTFTRMFAITPYVGYSSQTVGFIIPDTSLPGKIAGSSPAFGINGEAFVTFKRDLSINAGVMYSRFDAQDYFEYSNGGFNYQSDIFVDFNLIQFPVLVKYYLDLKPNKLRLFGEVGFSYAIPTYNTMGIYQAKKGNDSVVTSKKPLEMVESFSGATFGIGAEKYLANHRALNLGIRMFTTKGQIEDSVKGLTFYAGFKF